MRFNELKPAPGSKQPAKRVGRGKGSGLGKTAGRGVKGQKSRAGGGVKPGFEGGQMPLQRRLPKFGFKSRKGRFYAEVRLGTIARVVANETGEIVVDPALLKKAHVIDRQARIVKVIANGECNRAMTLRGMRVTRGARAAVEAAGGRIELPEEGASPE